MIYVPDIDEMLIPPPYRLGTDDTSYRLESHIVPLDTDHDKLQGLVNRHLNAPIGALPDSSDPTGIGYGKALPRGSVWGDDPEPVCLRYLLPSNLSTILLCFLRYWRVDTQAQPERGYMRYTEALIQFLVYRDIKGNEFPKEPFYFLGAVYIDDSAFEGQLQDPHSLPILLGREAFGLPKNPAQIHYCPDGPNFSHPPKVQIWDYDANQADLIRLEDAIVVNPPWAEPASSFCPPLPEPIDGGATFGVFAVQFGMEEEELKRRLKEPRVFSDPWIKYAKILTLEDGLELVVRSDLFLFAKLIGLKQFPDPTSIQKTVQDPSDPTKTLKTVDSCYQVIVESPLEYEEGNEPQWKAVVGDIEVAFPQRNRTDLIDAFGIAATNRRQKVEDFNISYTVGSLIYGRPARTDVWRPIP